MSNEPGLDRRKFMEIGIYAISGTMAVLSGAVLTRFTIGPSFNRQRPKWVGVELSAADRRLLWIPPGFAHGDRYSEDQWKGPEKYC